MKQLLAHVAEHRESHASEEAVAHLRKLHTRAVGTNAGTRRTADLQHLLEEADEKAREAASLERLLRQALHESQQQVNQLNVEIRSLRATRAADRQQASAEIERFVDEAQELRAERDQLQAEVKLLQRQLAEAVSARVLAEERCDQLERQIESAEERERESQRAATKEVENERAKRAEAQRKEAERARLKAEEESERTAREFQAAQERITKLQSELAEVRGSNVSPVTSLQQAAATKTDPPQRSRVSGNRSMVKTADTTAKDEEQQSFAVRLGYGPSQVLRRVDSAQKVNPPEIREILLRAFDLQSPEEVRRTNLLLQSMPTFIRKTFDDIVSRSVKGAATTDPDVQTKHSVKNQTEAI
ncbi:hypothetical protein DMH02_001040 [Streptomyces sp. WAC 00631]|uniref:hypothetical protein n=1 Tax=Streptomyces sp. WAC 00631 TaxID=2203201 RepID=UPI000F78FE0E|nr:hypothetical protein [Streptomyces sp. WAC 00631]MCC5031887.1 hypothetical protein [Streptomyces sp. WAC 00631]